ncbi:hypothetical protein GIB67_035675 [Kingdonia uniflora]|uniref:K-box domain-containing protein n=1 Tax=Kingdonia uniflora TaxID=39325 RepID=A0A7J7N5R2_9MAGN|nr:hypothetical protein GIB67_035675 [Kingdonia uniflora]
MKEILERQNLHSKNLQKLVQPSLELQLENSNFLRLSKEVAEKSHQLRQMRGEEIHSLNIEELKQLEKFLEVGLSRVLETKGERIKKEISTLNRNGMLLMQENEQLKQQIAHNSKGLNNVEAEPENPVFDEGQSSNSVTYTSSLVLLWIKIVPITPISVCDYVSRKICTKKKKVINEENAIPSSQYNVYRWNAYAKLSCMKAHLSSGAIVCIAS